MTSEQIEELKQFMLGGFLGALKDSLEERRFWDAFEYLTDNAEQIKTETKAKVFSINQAAEKRHFVYSGFLDCLRVENVLAKKIEKQFSISEGEREKIGFARIPSKYANLMISTNLAHKYGDLSKIPGFARFKHLWLADLDDRLSGAGFLMPVRVPSSALITELRVYRSVLDKKPFTLKTRSNLQINVAA